MISKIKIIILDRIFLAIAILGGIIFVVGSLKSCYDGSKGLYIMEIRGILIDKNIEVENRNTA